MNTFLYYILLPSFLIFFVFGPLLIQGAEWLVRDLAGIKILEAAG